jgi:hypothetical protein
MKNPLTRSCVTRDGLVLLGDVCQAAAGMNPKMPMFLRRRAAPDRTTSPREGASWIGVADAPPATLRRIVTRARRLVLLSFLLSLPCCVAVAQMGVQDIFGRALNQHGVTLVDWDGQHQVMLASSNLSNWTPVATNLSGTNLFLFIESNALQFPQRFYRAVVIP